MEKLIVSIDQNECTSCGLCPEFSKHFFMGDDDYAHVTDGNTAEDLANPVHNGMGDTVDVEEAQEADVVEVAEKCPGMCIYVEVVPVAEPVNA